ncbi:MAG: hypothetical protein LC670_14725 [Flavobacteriales bacterium]|nr:hypothetical protein [Flavobacteriales bacterium]
MTKQKLIETIRKINDQSILDDIQRLIQLELDDEIFVTGPAQKSAIEQARTEVKNGQTVSANKADKEIDEWLNE